MKKNLFWLVFAALFAVSCSSSDDYLPCVVSSDCPDNLSCVDGECTIATAEVTDSDTDSGKGSSNENGGGSGSEDNNQNGGSEEGGNQNGEGSETDDDYDPFEPDGNDSDTDNGQNDDTNDADNSEGHDGEIPDEGNDGENNDDTDGENGNDADNGGDDDPATVENCTKNEDCLSNPNNIRCDANSGKCVMCISDDDCLAVYGQSCDLTTHECVSNKTCAAAIEKMPHGGKFDWEDGKTQGFSTNVYWDVVNNTTVSNGKYSFGQYSGYTDNMDYTSVLQPVDLSLCSACKVNVLYFAKGKVPYAENGYDFIHPTCNGIGTTTARNSTGGTQTLAPQSPWDIWEMADAYYQKVNSYSTVAWTKSEWELPKACRTSQFVFGLRFSSNGSISYVTDHNYLGLVVDDLTIAPAATEFVPNGEIESAEGGNIKGWACDLDANSKNVLVKIEYYKNKDESAAAALRWAYAKLQRPGDPAVLAGCSETSNHGFEMPFDDGLKNILGEGTHSAAVFAVDIPAAENNCSGVYKKLGETREFVVSSADSSK